MLSGHGGYKVRYLPGPKSCFMGVPQAIWTMTGMSISSQPRGKGRGPGLHE